MTVEVIVTLVVFEQWIKRAIPGGLVAVVGAIAISWGFDLESHGVAVPGSVPSGLPTIGLPSGVGWEYVVLRYVARRTDGPGRSSAQRAATSRAYAIKYQDRFVENNDLRRARRRDLSTGSIATFPVNGSLPKTEMAGRALQLAPRPRLRWSGSRDPPIPLLRSDHCRCSTSRTLQLDVVSSYAAEDRRDERDPRRPWNGIVDRLVTAVVVDRHRRRTVVDHPGVGCAAHVGLSITSGPTGYVRRGGVFTRSVTSSGSVARDPEGHPGRTVPGARRTPPGSASASSPW